MDVAGYDDRALDSGLPASIWAMLSWHFVFDCQGELGKARRHMLARAVPCALARRGV